MDAKDILGIPKNSHPISQEKKSRPQKESQRKPDGISREVIINYFIVFFFQFYVFAHTQYDFDLSNFF